MTPPRQPMGSRARHAFITYGLPAFTAAAVVAATAWYTFIHRPRTRREAVAVITANLDQRMTMRRLAMEAWLDEAFQDAAVVASFPTVKAELGAARRGSRGTNQHLDDILTSAAAAERTEAIHVLDTALRTVSSTRHRLDSAAIPVLRAAMRSGRPAADFVRRANGSVRIVVATPVAAPAGEAIGVVAFVMSPSEWVFPFLAAPPVVEPSGEAFLVRRDGDSALYLSPMRQQPTLPMTFRRPLDAPGLAASAALAGASGVGAYSDYRGVPVFASTARLTGVPWALVVKVDQREALRNWRLRMWATALTEGGLLLLAALLVAALWWGQHKAHQAAESRARAHIAALLDQASDAILVLDVDGRIREANRRAHEFYGLPGTDLIGKSAFALRPEALRDEARARLEQVLARGEVFVRAIHRVAGGREAPVEVSARRVHVADDDAIVMVVRDITERQLAEARILRLNGILRTISETTQMVARGQSLHQVFQEACRIAVEQGGFRLAWIAVPDPDGTVRPVASAGATEYLDGIQIRWDDTPQGRGPAGTAIREDRTVVVADAATDAAVATWRERALGFGLRSSAACPFRKADVVAGALMLYADSPCYFDVETTVLLEELASDLGLALRSFDERAALQSTLTALRETEARFRLLVEGAPLGVFIQSDGRFRYLNRAAVHILGATGPEALIGTTVFDRFHPDFHDVVRERIRRIHDEGQAAPPVEQRWLRMDGEELAVEVEAVPVDYEGSPAVIVFFRDITEERQSRAEQALLSTALEQSAEVAIITDTQGTIVYVNPAFERITGYARTEALGRNPRILKSGRHDAEFYVRMWSALTTGQAFTGTIVNRKKNGDTYVAEVAISPIRDEFGKVTRYLGLQRDVTREHDLEDQLRQSQKMDAVGRLSGGIAHDFNNLLGVIMANAAVLRRDLPLDRGDLRDYVDDLLEAATNGAAMVRKLLAFSRRERLTPVALDLGRALEEVGRTLQRFLPETIAVRVTTEGQLIAVVDLAALEQMMLNLATNARDAMPGGGTLTIQGREIELREPAEAEHGVDQPGRYVCVDVTDTGHGMDEETLAHAFEPFFTTKPSGAGTGLGLAMVFGLVRQHGGFVRVTSVPGEGTTVRLYFRAARVAKDPGPQPAVATPVKATAAAGVVLVVEDQERLRRATARALGKLGYEVLVAEGAEEALRLMDQKSGEIDLVLSDLVMPGMSGVALHQRLRAAGQTVPFLLMSGYAFGTGQAKEVPDSIPLIMKPWTLEALDAQIRQLIGDRLPQ